MNKKKITYDLEFKEDSWWMLIWALGLIIIGLSGITRNLAWAIFGLCLWIRGYKLVREEVS